MGQKLFRFFCVLVCFLWADCNAVVLEQQDSLVLDDDSKTNELCTYARTKGLQTPGTKRTARYVLELKPRGTSDDKFSVISEGKLADGVCQAVELSGEHLVVSNANGYAGYAFYSNKTDSLLGNFFSLPSDEKFMQSRTGSIDLKFSTRMTVRSDSSDVKETSPPSGCDSGKVIKTALIAACLLVFNL